MPIKIPDTLPAFQTLVQEGVSVMTDSVAIRQDIRPLQIGLLNLMPNKIKTEVQIARLVGASDPFIVVPFIIVPFVIVPFVVVSVFVRASRDPDLYRCVVDVKDAAGAVRSYTLENAPE